MVSDEITALLEEIAALAACSFISDLHNVENAARVRNAVCTVAGKKYSAAAWRGAGEYITGGLDFARVPGAAKTPLAEAVQSRAAEEEARRRRTD